ncbi:response regulator [Rhodophyticola sp. CCM32]|uniref:response regulator n=1 Tax=Rhodophyticola sp. CCM32 TaxID=2916397 RepID=UPI00107F9588|nr:response regulator [Rhodophyticola sp. CCM32]QBX99388.1 response regulator [Rhodophyticola sp. CCM32]
MKILAVDDDESILELLPIIAAQAGFDDLTTVTSGEDALDILTDDKGTLFDCLLFDIKMPGLDGIELCARVRKIPAYRRTPILMLTVLTDMKYVDEAFKAGATDYASKPFDVIELGARLRIAQELAMIRKGPIMAVSPEGETPSAPLLTQRFDLSDEIEIEGIDDLVDYTALGNYLTQLSRAGLASTQVVAVKIDRIEGIYAKASQDEFIYALTEVAEAISEIFEPNGYIMAYAGNGVFVIISNRATLLPSIELEAEIQSQLDDRNTEYDNGEPLDLEVSMGRPIRPNASKTQRVRKTFERAISRAENKMTKKRNDTQIVNICLAEK